MCTSAAFCPQLPRLRDTGPTAHPAARHHAAAGVGAEATSRDALDGRRLELGPRGPRLKLLGRPTGLEGSRRQTETDIDALGFDRRILRFSGARKSRASAGTCAEISEDWATSSAFTRTIYDGDYEDQLSAVFFRASAATSACTTCTRCRASACPLARAASAEARTCSARSSADVAYEFPR